MKKTILFAALLLAAVAPLRGQDFQRLNDTTWVRHTLTTSGVVTDYAYKLDQAALTAKLNNDLRNTAILQAGSLGAGALAVIEAYRYGQSQTKARLAAAIVFGVASAGCGIASIFTLYQDKVYLSPEGIVIRIGRTDYPTQMKKGLF